MDDRGRGFLADAKFAGDEDRCVQARRVEQPAEQVGYRRTLAHEFKFALDRGYFLARIEHARYGIAGTRLGR